MTTAGMGSLEESTLLAFTFVITMVKETTFASSMAKLVMDMVVVMGSSLIAPIEQWLKSILEMVYLQEICTSSMS